MQADSPVLLFGETGTGKGVFAKLIHEASARRSGPFYAGISVLRAERTKP